MSFSECSRPSNSFAFDLLSIFGTISNNFDALLPSSANEPLAGYREASQFAISGYIVGITTIVISLALCFNSVVLEWRGRFHLWTTWKYGDIAAFVLSAVCSKIRRVLNFILIFIKLAWIFITGASTAVTVIYYAIHTAIQQLGAHTSLGRLVVAAWFAVALSFAVFISCLKVMLLTIRWGI